MLKEEDVETLIKKGMPREEAENFLSGKVSAMKIRFSGAKSEEVLRVLTRYALLTKIEAEIMVPVNRQAELADALNAVLPNGVRIELPLDAVIQ